MITPQEIRAKAVRLYPQFVTAWLQGEDIFPYRIRTSLKPSKNMSEAIAEQQLLRSMAKSATGYGYSLQFERRNSRGYGQQDFIDAILIDTQEDLLHLAGKTREFRNLSGAVKNVRSAFPELNDWLVQNWKQLIPAIGCIDALQSVVQYLLEHPRPSCFMRELPLAISTKLIENHTGLLSQWLDILLDPSDIDVSYPRERFAERYGFRSPDDHVLLKLLDESLMAELQCPGTELMLPEATLARLPVESVRNVRVLIVENKTNLLSLPALPRTLAIGGLGRAVTRFERVPWIDHCPILYWGDIDIEGFQILSTVRTRWPQTRSIFMDCAALQQFKHWIIGRDDQATCHELPINLSHEERLALIACIDNRWRLEQERIPQVELNELFQRELAASATTA